MGRALAWLGGAFGLAALWRFLKREQAQQQQQSRPPADPAAELRAKLEQAREVPDDRDEFDASEGQPVDEVGHAHEPAAPATEPAEPEPAEPEAPRSLEERRRAIHEKAQQALGEMHRPGPDE